MAESRAHESEWQTRKRRIDPRLDAAGWPLPKGKPTDSAFRSEEEETSNGPADYALWLDNQIAGVVEAKKLTVGSGPRNDRTGLRAQGRDEGISARLRLGDCLGLAGLAMTE